MASREGAVWTLTDLGSTNGLQVNGERRRSIHLAPGDGEHSGEEPSGRMVPRDSEAAVLLQCWEAGLIVRDEVMDRTGLSERAYDRARKRLLYLSQYLTPALRESAQDLLRRSS